jgi:hypothetical protein
LFALTASGDGLFIVRDDVPPKLPYQRALNVFDGTNETLLVQSAFEQRTGMPSTVGWIVPVPNVPELAGMSAVAPPNFWARHTPMPHYLCKCKGRLTPAQMRSDLYFSRAPDQEPYTALTLHWF